MGKMAALMLGAVVAAFIAFLIIIAYGSNSGNKLPGNQPNEQSMG
jgi:hypothetical protein